MPDRSSIPWRLKAGACLASATLSAALVAVFAAPTLSAQQKPAAPSRFVQPEPIDFNDHDGRTQILGNPTISSHSSNRGNGIKSRSSPMAIRSFTS